MCVWGGAASGERQLLRLLEVSNSLHQLRIKNLKKQNRAKDLRIVFRSMNTLTIPDQGVSMEIPIDAQQLGKCMSLQKTTSYHLKWPNLLFKTTLRNHTLTTPDQGVPMEIPIDAQQHGKCMMMLRTTSSRFK